MRRIASRVGLLLGLLMLVLAAGVVVPRPLLSPTRSDPASEGRSRLVLLLSNPIHTDIALPADADVLARFAPMASDNLPIGDPQLRWIVLGWGGRAFYVETPTWADLKPLPVLRALTIDASVMHVQLAGAIDTSHPSVRRLQLDGRSFAALLDRVERSFVREEGALQVAAPGYGSHDLFYSAHGWFNALVGCNTWTAAMLRSAGVRTGAWTPLPVLLDWSLDLHHPQPRPGRS